jgi:RHS repeat-associated protein
MDRLASRTDPLQRTETPLYDLLGNVISWRDRKGQVSAYSHDPLNRLTFAGFNKQGSGSTATYEGTASYTYDGDNRLAQATDSAAGTISYSYDGLDRLLSVTTPQGTLSYGYDLVGRRISRSLTGQPDVTYTWDNGGRLTQIAQGGSSVGITYDNADRRSVLTLPNGVTATYTYDAGSRLTGLSYQLGATAIGDLTYSYDALGRVTQMGGSLARAQWPSAVSSVTYDAANELTSWNGMALTYDANGNMTSDGNRTFTWNARDQLVSMSGAAFQYDAFGRRIGKTVGSASTNFLYDGANIIQENSGAANILTGGTDEFFLRTDSGGSVVPITDALGSVLALVDSSGAVQTQYSYDAFGQTNVGGFAGSNSAQYTGRENDGTGLYYYRSRYYDPAIGRFISEDPIQFASGTTNFYSYVGNDPIDYFDPFGLSRDCGKPKCFAQLKYRPVQDWRAKMFSRNHVFWYVQGSTGIQYVLSGGPNPPNGGNQHLNVWPNQDIHGGVDNVSATVWWDSGLSAENCKGLDAMIAAANGWPQDTIPYHPVEGPNSDTAAHSLGTTGGFNPTAPPGTMGWNTPLPPALH